MLLQWLEINQGLDISQRCTSLQGTLRFIVIEESERKEEEEEESSDPSGILTLNLMTTRQAIDHCAKPKLNLLFMLALCHNNKLLTGTKMNLSVLITSKVLLVSKRLKPLSM